MPDGAVLLTRPLADSRETAAFLAARGIDTVIAPLMEIAVRDEVPPLADVQAVLITSANGLRAFAGQSARRDIPVFAVGDASARAAGAAGFVTVESAAGDVHDLANLVRRRLRPAVGALLHPAGTVLAGDLAAMLAADGFDVRRYVAYAAKPADRLPDAAVQALRDGTIAAVLLYSPRTATLFRDLADAAGMARYCAKIEALCLSQAVMDALSPMVFRDIRVALRPDQASLLSLLDIKGEKLH
ncbi:MAG: uroporphyrinogen-III synthase [Alphaproteobacteria bacterium]|jgi:uroporphyrinogen-III synthase